MQLTYSEHNYLQAIYHLASGKAYLVSTTELAHHLSTSAASITDMVQKLDRKQLVSYKKYRGVSLTCLGKRYARQFLRQQMLWEVFLADKLKCSWDEIESVSKRLAHIESAKMIAHLFDFLGQPAYSPQGRAIPTATEDRIDKPKLLLTEVAEGVNGVVSAIQNETTDFLAYLAKRNIYLGAKIRVVEKVAFDESLDIIIDNHYKINLSRKITDNLLIMV